MHRSKLVLPLVAFIVLSLALMGCGVGPSSLRLFSAPTASPRVVEKVVVATPTTAPAAGAAQAPAAPVNVSPVADIETQILKTVYEKVNPSVVSIENQTRVTQRAPSDQTVPESQGSGFIWDAEGHIITNNHVVAGADRLQVTFSDGIVVTAEIIGTDADSDLAVIQVDPKLVKLIQVQQGKIADVKVGQRAIAIGNPYGLVGTMTSGIVSAIGRSIASDPTRSSFNIPQVIQTDAAVNPGNSGGPLLNDRGEVIGVTAQIRSTSGSNSGVGFAIPINIVQRVAPALIKDGRYRHAYLGISGRTYSPAWAEALGFTIQDRGAYVMAVVAGGPADKAGVKAASKDTRVVLGVGTSGPVYLQSGGDLVVGIDDQAVTTFDDLLVYLEGTRSPGETIKLTVLRAGEGRKTLTLTLGERPAQPQQ